MNPRASPKHVYTAEEPRPFAFRCVVLLQKQGKFSSPPSSSIVEISNTGSMAARGRSRCGVEGLLGKVWKGPQKEFLLPHSTLYRPHAESESEAFDRLASKSRRSSSSEPTFSSAPRRRDQKKTAKPVKRTKRNQPNTGSPRHVAQASMQNESAATLVNPIARSSSRRASPRVRTSASRASSISSPSSTVASAATESD